MSKRNLILIAIGALLVTVGVISTKLARPGAPAPPETNNPAETAPAAITQARQIARLPTVKLANPETAESLIRPIEADLLDPAVANTPEAILAVSYAAYGLGNEQRSTIEAAYAEFNKAIKALRREHVTVVKDSPEEQIYEIKPFAEQAETEWQTFFKTVTEVLGEKNATTLRRSLESRSLNDLALLGRLIHRLIFQPQANGKLQIESQTIWPEDGLMRSMLVNTVEELPRNVADLFEIASE